MIPEHIIDHIKSAIRIEDEIAKYITLRKAGANYKAVCPFHGDRDASLMVSPSKAIWKCFGCGQGGDVIRFVQEHEGLSYPQAIRQLANQHNIDIPDSEDEEERAKRLARESLFLVLEYAATTYSEQLRQNKEAMQYLLHTRGVSFDAINAYRLGVAIDSFQAMSQSITTAGYSMSNAVKAGLISERDNGRTYDTFRNRLMFPFIDNNGHVIGFTGRTLDSNNDIKYQNTKETELFHKGEVLFGLSVARPEIRRTGIAYLVEGQFDVIRLFDSGIKNAICGSGTALTEKQAGIIRRHASDVVLIYDGDSAGIAATKKNINTLLRVGLNVRVVSLPPGVDPDEHFRTLGPEEAKKYLKKNTKDFVTYLYDCLPQDSFARGEGINSIADSIAIISDKIVGNELTAKLIKLTGYSPEDIKDTISSSRRNTPTPTEANNLLFGIDDLPEPEAGMRPVVRITYNPDTFTSEWADRPIVLAKGLPELSDIQSLRAYTTQVDTTHYFSIDTVEEEPDDIKFFRALYREGFNIIVHSEETTTIEDSEGNISIERTPRVSGWLEHYIAMYAPITEGSEFERTTAINRCAEEMSYADTTTITANIKRYAQQLHIAKGDLDRILKPYRSARVAETAAKTGAIQDEDGASIYTGTSELPAYVRNNKELYEQYERFGFFPILSRNGRKIAYMFGKPNNFKRVGNFYITPLLHIYDRESSANKRVVEISVSHRQHPTYMEWVSKDMTQLQQFRNRLWEEGDITFSNGTGEHLNALLESWTGRFVKCDQLYIYGWHNEGFFAFANGIFHDDGQGYRFDPVDDRGVVTHNGKNYYIPVFSKIYTDQRRDNDIYLQDRYLKYVNNKQCPSFTDWAKLFDTVYSLNNNGKWGLIYAIMSAFRSDIFEIDRCFTALFLIGPTGCGKSELAYSIRALYLPQEAGTFNLNSGTNAAMFTLMEKYRNIPVMMEEYNDAQIDDVKFQALKAATYDGEGKQKRKSADSKELDSSQVNAPLIILGQETPQRDDNSLTNRTIICDVPKKDDRTDEEVSNFLALKAYEKAGLHPILSEILQIREVVKKNYHRIQLECYRELKERIRHSITSSDGLSRILNTTSIFLSVCRIVEELTPLSLPFRYSDFFRLACEKVIGQVESIGSSNRLYTFFNTLSVLVDARKLIEGRDFKISAPERNAITIQATGRETKELTLPRPGMRILFLRIGNVHSPYAQMAGSEALTQQSLRKYLASAEYHLGTAPKVRFEWMESVQEAMSSDIQRYDGASEDDDPLSPGNTINPLSSTYNMTTRNVMRKISINPTSAIALDYDMIEDQLGISLTRDKS